MSQEQANTYKKHRDAVDPAGNIAWAARLNNKALRHGPEAAARIDVERAFELTDDEKVIWRLLRLPRKYIDVEHTGLLVSDKMRGFLRGLVAADVVDIVEGSEAKALLPAEVTRIKAEIAGKEIHRKREPLRGRVYRPDIDGQKPEVVDAEGSEAVDAAPAPAARSAPMSDDDLAYKAEVERAHAALQKQNHYEFLGLPQATDDPAVRAAYVRLARLYHPDRAAGDAFNGDDSLKFKVDVLFKRLGDAQAAIGTVDARQTYNRTLAALGDGGGKSADGKKQRRPLEAKSAFTMAETFFKKKEFKQAEAHYRQAANFDFEDPKILTGLAVCIWMNPDHNEEQRTAEARKRFSDIVSQFKYGDAAYRLGLLLRKLRDEAGAQRQFNVAHRLDPSHVEAGREVRLIEMRSKKADEEKQADKSIFGKLGLGKK